MTNNENETGIDVRKESPFALGGRAGGINANTNSVQFRCYVCKCLLMSNDIYARDFHGNKYCSKKCVIKACDKDNE